MVSSNDKNAFDLRKLTKTVYNKEVRKSSQPLHFNNRWYNEHSDGQTFVMDHPKCCEKVVSL